MDYQKCSSCGKQDETVVARECGYSKEINDESVIEIICDACEHEHLMDI